MFLAEKTNQLLYAFEMITSLQISQMREKRLEQLIDD
jgi:hypothetical protein